MDEFLLHMKSFPLWESIEEELRGYRPIIPTYNHKDDNTADWMYESAKQEGFDLCLTLLKIGVLNDQ